MRTCLGCRERDEPRRLVRIVAEQGVAIPEGRERLPGRGAWVHPTPECVAKCEPKLRRALRVRALDTARIAEIQTLDSSESEIKGTKTTMDN
ncbi:YlxR family protein [uncultured Agrococcus sp.]|uniref:YlxR family protein n=1 Tax=uncultured Agrococcus sp. TaxID=382258 RepID=UPI00344F6B67